MPSPTRQESDPELSSSDRFARAGAVERGASDYGNRTPHARGCSATFASLEDQASAIDRVKREVTVVLEEASQQFSKGSNAPIDLQTASGLMHNQADIQMQLMRMTKLLMQLMEKQPSSERLPPEQARHEGRAWLEKANDAMERLRAPPVLGSHEASIQASHGRRADRPAPVVRADQSNRKDTVNSYRKRKHRSATMPCIATHVDQTPSDDAGRVVDHAETSSISLHHREREEQQFVNRSQDDGPVPATPEATLCGSHASSQRGGRTNADSNHTMNTKLPLSSRGNDIPHVQRDGQLGPPVTQSNRAVDALRSDQGTSYPIATRPMHIASPSGKRDQRHRRTSTISPCHRARKRGRHDEPSIGLQSKKHVNLASRSDQLRRPTTSPMHSTKVDTKRQADMSLQLPARETVHVPETRQDSAVLERDRATTSTVFTACQTAASNVAQQNKKRPKAHSRTSEHARTSNMAVGGNITATAPVVEPSNNHGKKRTKVTKKESEISDSGQVKGKKKKTSVSAADGEGTESNTQDDEHGQRLGFSRDDSELPDLADLIGGTFTSRIPANPRIPANNPMVGSQAQAEGADSALMKTRRNSASKTPATTTPGTPHKRKRSRHVAAVDPAADEASEDKNDRSPKRPRCGTTTHEASADSSSSHQTLDCSRDTHQTSMSALSVPHNRPCSPKKQQETKAGCSSGRALPSSRTGTAQPHNASQPQNRDDIKAPPIPRPWFYHRRLQRIPSPGRYPKSWHQRCRCIGLPGYFYEDAHEKPSLATWSGVKEDFLAHCEQIIACPGHLSITKAACHEALNAEQEQVQV